MVGSFEFDAEIRTEAGKGDARRSRRLGKIPAIVYGGGAEPVKLFLAHHRVVKALQNDAVYSHVLTLRYGGKEDKAILKAMERHPSRPIIMHMDFQRINEKDKIRVHIPLRFLNQDTSLGVKRGGVISHALVEVEVICLPQNLPEHIEVDMAQVDVGGMVHLSDLQVPKGVEIAELTHGAINNRMVASTHTTHTTEAE